MATGFWYFSGTAVVDFSKQIFKNQSFVTLVGVYSRSDTLETEVLL